MASAFLTALAGALPVSAGEPAGPGRSAQNNTAEGEITPELDAAVAKGLAFLASQQNADGSFDGGRFGKNVAITALACIAFMADGNLPGRGLYADQVSRGLDFILDNCTESGLIAAEGAHGPMYGHGFATLFLGEVYGMTGGGVDTARSARVHESLVRAVRLIERTQNDEGGWRYNPVPYDADVSVTICQVMALRSARNAGIEVDKSVIDRAVAYARRCQNVDGGFRYQASGGSSAWPRSAGGVATLFYAGIYEDTAINTGLSYLERTAMPGRVRGSKAHYAYGQYYAVQAMYLAGGRHWAEWWPAVRSELIADQADDGGWEDRTAGPNYGTAMMLIVLQMPKRYLPIFQK
ncbi:MAG TPA: prenyltransferase [Phycisphaerales bacterium]|nr:prenyltransferase [Phycisphaerales bacterium]